MCVFVLYFFLKTQCCCQNCLTLKDYRENIGELRNWFGNTMSVMFWQCFNKGIHKTGSFLAAVKPLGKLVGMCLPRWEIKVEIHDKRTVEFVKCLWYVCLWYTTIVAWVIKKIRQLLTQCNSGLESKQGWIFLSRFFFNQRDKLSVNW